MAPPRLLFDHVTKTFRDRSAPRVLRDAIPSAMSLLAGRSGPRRTRFVALDDVSFEVAAGEALGIVGHNGAGKSTSLKLAAGVYRPDSGKVVRSGRASSLIELSAGFHPDLTGRENVFLSGALVGIRRAEVRALLPQILEFAGLGEFIDAPLRVYSTGMVVRLGFAVAVHAPSEMLLVDEVLSVGDLEYQTRCIERMAERRREGVSVLLVSHHLALIEQFCDRVLIVRKGRKIVDGPPAAALDEYRRQVLAAAEGPTASADPAVRRGTGEVRITGVSIRGDDVAEVTLGRPFRIELSLHSKEGAPFPTLGILVQAPGGAVVASAIRRGVDAPGPVPTGDWTTAVEFTRNALLPGPYVLTVFARDREGFSDLDLHDKTYRLLVRGERPAGEQGLVSMGPVWTR